MSCERTGPLPRKVGSKMGVLRAIGKLANAPSQPDETIARVLGTCAGYAYSDMTTVATMMTRLGLPDNRCLQVSEFVDAMFICSTAFIVQSSDNQVVILCYRGTQPTSIINWLSNLTIEPTAIQIPPKERLDQARGNLYVHGGFYRNVRATRYRVGGGRPAEPDHDGPRRCRVPRRRGRGQDRVPVRFSGMAGQRSSYQPYSTRRRGGASRPRCPGP